MQSAQLVPKHSAQLSVMQAAYASGVKISSPRHLNRMRRLAELVKEAGGPSALAAKVATPKSHISALIAGNRGVGDKLAAKLERKCDKAIGWMDLPAQPIDGVTVAETREPATAYSAVPSPSEWAHLEEFRQMSDDDRAAIEQETAARSERWKKLRREFLASFGITGEADNASVQKALGNLSKTDAHLPAAERVPGQTRATRPETEKQLDNRQRNKRAPAAKKSRTG